MFPADPGTSGAPPERTGFPGAPASGPGTADGAAPDSARRPAEGGPPAPPSVSLPKGGGAIKDIGEKFAVSAATGTASLTVPVATSPGRAGLGPALSLSYDSGGGNGPFGLGWKISLPSITRKTDKGLPRYADDPDADAFILSGAEDLVPIRTEVDGTWRETPGRRTEGGRDYLVQRYRPRIEGLFSRIERWRDLDSGEAHWRTITSANVITIYGASPASRIADPADPSRVFSWLISATYDDTGNAMAYDYVGEDSAGIDTALPSERNRTPRSRSANRYLKRIRYGNRESWQPGLDALRSRAGPRGGWLFETVFDYGDHREDAPLPEPDRDWPVRDDPFSTYRPGFEVRTYRRCHRVLMFHHFPDEPGVGANCLVASTDLVYASTGGSGMTTVASVTHTGYRRRDGGYHSASLPPLELRYSADTLGTEVRDLCPEALENLPAGVDGTAYQWADLDGEGLSGILARQGEAWFYKRNLGDGRFAAPRMLTTQPATGPGARQQLLDLAGDGHLDLAELGGPMPGCYQRTGTGGWQSFRPFRSCPNISWDDPDLRMVDLDGDGLADVLITGDDAFTWYPSLGLDGFGDGRRAFSACPWSEERGPRLMLADPEQTIYLADMSGDGLSDLVRVRDGEVCYWPNTGFGRFGAKVTMDRSPWMDRPGGFDQRRVRLGDVDGTGCADLIYLGSDEVRVYLNQSGNGYGDPLTVPQAFPRLDSVAHVMVADLLGHGTACLVWSSPLPDDAGRQVRYVDLMTTGKPYLLTELINNVGAETVISYAPSTKFYLADQAAGRPWITRLPFPVQVVERVETIDRINRNRFTTCHAYHHGYYDGGFEREFRGFGMVEHWDTEDLAVLEGNAGDFANLDRASDLPPVLTRTWLHTGVFPHEGWVSRQYAREYWRQPGGGDPDLPDTELPSTLRLPGRPRRPWQLSRTEAREACRALKGMPLREEVYALDGSEAESRPYMVTEHNYTIELLQPAITPVPDGPQSYHAVLLTHARESVTAHYERALYRVPDGSPRADPRITHNVVLAIDDFGNPLRSASAAYGRRYPDPALAPEDQAVQGRLRLTYTENGYTNAVELPDAYRTPMPARTRVFEVVGLAPAGRLFGFAELRDALAAVSAELPFQEWAADPAALPAPARRLISHTSVRYRRDDLSGALPPGVLESLALPYQGYRQAFTDSLVADLYGGGVDDETLKAAGYLREGEAWWLPSGLVFYSPGDDDSSAELDYARRHFFEPHRFTDPFGNTTTVSYDRYDLLVRQTRDPLGNLVTAGERNAADEVTNLALNYRVLSPYLISDPNRNRAAAAFDTLGRVCGTAVMGKPEEPLGDSLAGFEPDPAPAAVEAYFADPFAHGHELLGAATTRLLYDLDAYRRSAGEVPAGVAALARETHVSDLAAGEQTKIQRRFSYSDGFGREIQRKGQAAAGPVTEGGPDIGHRWIGSGWTVFNNKGKPVRQYEPFFTTTPGFEFARAEGVSAVLFYDPPGRVIAFLNPDDGYAKTTFDPWHQDDWDTADTVLLDPRDDPDVRGYASRYLAALNERPGGWSTWYAQRIGGELGRAEQRAAEQTAAHAGTPTRRSLDTLGRTFLTVAHNRVRDGDGRLTDQYCQTRTLLDIQGNGHAVRDALGRTAMRYGFSMLSGQVSHAGMDTGGAQVLPDVLGQPVYSRNSRGFVLRTDYDALRRPVRTHVAGPGIAGVALQELTEYGESVPDPAARNLRTRVVRQFDGAGIAASSAYDFKGNLLSSARTLAAEYADAVVDWASDVPLEDREYTASTGYDALNRPISVTPPDGSVLTSSYDPAGLLGRLDGRLRGADATTAFAEHIEYNARGQRILIQYGNGTATAFSYDPLTFRLTRVVTLRGARRLQDLRYTYDGVGNPTQITDRAQQDVFFRNRVVSPSASYTYDALYRLTEAKGREHLGQGHAGRAHVVPPSATDKPRAGLPQPGDGSAMARYLERYIYDEVGNLLLVKHRSADPGYGGWTRAYRYEEPSLLEPGRPGNRLTGTGPARAASPPQRFRYDEQGNTMSMPEIPLLRWDYADRLHATARLAERDGEPDPQEMTYYVYDAAGQRARKVTQRAQAAGPAVRKTERIYVSVFEILREYGPDGALTLERETLHVYDDKQRLALAETRTAGTDRGPADLIRYQLANHLDSSVLELDQDAQVISYEEYYPYGSTSYQAVRALTETPKRYRYTGKERDTETGLYCNGVRCYAPWLGRWTSCDPAGMADGVNLYAYVRDNPITLHDPTGREGKPPLPGLIGNDPIVGGLWEKVVKERFGGSTYEDSLKIFRSNVASRVKNAGGSLGSNRAKGSAIHYARQEFNAVRARFARLLKAEKGISLKGFQVHHGVHDLAKKPHRALDHWNLGIEKGHAATPGSGHNFAGKVREAHAAGAKNAGLEVRLAEEAKGVKLDVPQLGPSVPAEHEAAAALKTEAKVEAKQAFTEGAKVGAKEALEVEGKTGLKEGAKLVGGKAAKFVPFVGVGVGVGLVAMDLHKGDYGAAAWDTGEAIPVVGDVVGAFHLGITTGTAINEGLGIENIATEHGAAVEHAAKSLGLGEDASRVVGGIGAGLSSITAAPAIAISRKVSGWFE